MWGQTAERLFSLLPLDDLHCAYADAFGADRVHVRLHELYKCRFEDLAAARRVAQGREARAAKAKLEAKAAAARAGAMIDDTADVVFLAAPRPNGPR
jgi:hypothetical protein